MYFNNLEDIKQYANEIIYFYSDNDPYVKYEIEKDFADKIAIEQVLIPNAGHINRESGYDIFIDLNGESIVNIFYSDKAIATLTFMESTLVEANIVAPLMHKLYSYCHGRHTFNRNHDKKAILIGYNGSDLENVLIENFKYQMKEYIVLKSKFEDDIINDFYLTIQAVYLLRNIALSMNIDLSEIKYDKIAAKRLFNFKGSV